VNCNGGLVASLDAADRKFRDGRLTPACSTSGSFVLLQKPESQFVDERDICAKPVDGREKHHAFETKEAEKKCSQAFERLEGSVHELLSHSLVFNKAEVRGRMAWPPSFPC
jgi:hypothetical protein